MTKPALPFTEFVILIAILFSLIAFGTDAMLPAFPEIAEDLKLDDANQAQLVLSSFVLRFQRVAATQASNFSAGV